MIRLEEPQLGVFELGLRNGIRVESYDSPLPIARANVTDRTAANGTDDYTRLYGARNIAMTLHVAEEAGAGRQATLDLLRAYCSPARRPYLFVDLDGSGVERRIQVRGSDLGAPITLPGYAAVQLSLVAPEGIFEAAEQSVARVSSVVVGDYAGRSYGKTYPYRYRKASLTGVGRVGNAGTEPAPAVYRLYGPCVNPYLINVDTGDEIRFIGGLTLSATQYVEVDSVALTALFNGQPGSSVYGNLDLLRTDFGYIAPGLNRIRYKPESFDTGAFAEVRFRSAWL